MDIFKVNFVPWAANDTTRAQINNIPSKSHVIPLLNITKFFALTDAETIWLETLFNTTCRKTEPCLVFFALFPEL